MQPFGAADGHHLRLPPYNRLPPDAATGYNWLKTVSNSLTSLHLPALSEKLRRAWVMMLRHSECMGRDSRAAAVITCQSCHSGEDPVQIR